MPIVSGGSRGLFKVSVEPLLFRNGNNDMILRGKGKYGKVSVEPLLFRNGNRHRGNDCDYLFIDNVSVEPLLFRNGNNNTSKYLGNDNAILFQWSHFFSEMEIG